MARVYLTGDKELEATLSRLADKAADRVARSALGAGLTVLVKAMRKAAPVGPTGNLRRSIGRRLESRKRSGRLIAKAGVNVGKGAVRKGRTAPHSHLVAMGTQRRSRKRLGGQFAGIADPTPQQLSTGTMPANPFIRRATESSRSAVALAMRKRAEKKLAQEATRKGK